MSARPQEPWLARLAQPALYALTAFMALAAVATAGAWAAPSRAPANPPDSTLSRVQQAATLRVCIWPDYYGITWRNPRTQQLQGLDIDMAHALGKDLGVKVEFVETTFPKFMEDLNQARCEVAMFGVGNLPQRAAQVHFSPPYLVSGIYGITTRSNRLVRQWADIDQPGVNVGVQAGTFMEKVMADSLKKARLVVVRPPATREQELEAGRVDVFMTDYPYSRRLLDNADWARLVSPPAPYHPLSYGYPVKPGDAAWAERIAAFVAAVKRDGRLAQAAQRHGLTEIVVGR